MRLLLAALGCALLFAGCSRPEYIMPSVPLTQDMSAYQTLNVEVAVPDGMVNAAGVQSGIKEGISKEIRMQNVVAKTDVPEPDVLVKVTLVDLDQGSELGRAAAGQSGPVGLAGALSGDGEGSITVEVELTDVKKAARLAAFTAHGISKDPLHPTTQEDLNNPNLSGPMRDVVGPSIAFASREIARYLKTRKIVAD